MIDPFLCNFPWIYCYTLSLKASSYSILFGKPLPWDWKKLLPIKKFLNPIHYYIKLIEEPMYSYLFFSNLPLTKFYPHPFYMILMSKKYYYHFSFTVKPISYMMEILRFKAFVSTCNRKIWGGWLREKEVLMCWCSVIGGLDLA